LEREECRNSKQIIIKHTKQKTKTKTKTKKNIKTKTKTKKNFSQSCQEFATVSHS